MGKTYKKNDFHTFSDSGQGKEIAGKTKKQYHYRQRKANKCTDWEHNDRAVPVTKHRKCNLVKEYDNSHLMKDKTIVPNFEHYTLSTVCHVPHWTDGSSLDTQDFVDHVAIQLNNIDCDRNSTKDPAFIAACQKQLERRGRLGAFHGHCKKKALRL